jgi:hypothetical protein
MLTIPMCVFCRHRPLRIDQPLSCLAFPDGIPRDILELQLDHRRAFPGDHGVQFEARDAEAAHMVMLRWGTKESVQT